MTYSIIECDDNGCVDINGKEHTYKTIEDFKNGIKEMASEGWKFCGFHPSHMGKDFDLIYVNRTGEIQKVKETDVWHYNACGKMTFWGRP